MQYAAVRLDQNERGHEVLKHRARPGSQTSSCADGIKRPSQGGPMAHGYVAFGNGDQAGQARFRRQQIVKAGVMLLLGHAIADVQQMASWVIQKREVGSPGKALGMCGYGFQTNDFCRARRVLIARRIEAGETSLSHRQKVPAEVAAIDGRHIHRQQRRASLGVVPVQKMAFMSSQGVERCQGGF